MPGNYNLDRSVTCHSAIVPKSIDVRPCAFFGPTLRAAFLLVFRNGDLWRGFRVAGSHNAAEIFTAITSHGLS